MDFQGLLSEQMMLSEPVTERDHIQGRLSAEVLIVEYGDYECPDCLNALPIIEKVREELGERLGFVFRHYPQSSIHPHASAAAMAAEAAGDQGKFWEMHYQLFKNQKNLADKDLSHLALQIGLEIYKFETSRNREMHRRRISADVESGRRSGVKGTPTLYINSYRYQGPMTSSDMIRGIGLLKAQ